MARLNFLFRIAIICSLMVVVPVPQPVLAQQASLLWSRAVRGYDFDVSASSDGRYIALLQQVPPTDDFRLSLISSTGETLWTYVSNLLNLPVVLSPTTEHICVGYGRGIAAFGLNGKLLWNVTLWGRLTALMVGDSEACTAATQTDLPFPAPTAYSLLHLDTNGRTVWNTTLNGKLDHVRTLAISDDAEYIAAGTGYSAGSYQIYLFDKSGDELWSRKPGGGSIDTVFVTSNATYIAAGSGENEIYLYDGNGNLQWRREAGGPILKVTMPHDESNVIAASRDGYLYYFGLDGTLFGKEQFAARYGAYPVSLSENGKYLVQGGFENNISLSEIDGRRLWSQSVGGFGGIAPSWVPSISYQGEYTAWSGDGIILVNKEGTILWQATTGSSIWSSLISSTGNYVVAISDKVYLFDKTGKTLWAFQPPYVASAISISSDVEYVAIGSSQLYLLDRSGKVLWTYQGDTTFDAISPFSSDGSFFAVGGLGQNVSKAYLFSNDGRVLWSRNMYVGVTSLSANGNYLAVGSSDGIYLFDRSGRLLWNDSIGLVQGVSSTVDGGYVAAVAMNTSYYTTLYYYKKDGTLLWSRQGVSLPFSFSADKGEVMVRSGENMTIFDRSGTILWTSPTPFESGMPDVSGAPYAFLSSDGEYIASTNSGTKIYFMQMGDQPASTHSTEYVLPTATGILGIVAIAMAIVRFRRRKLNY